MLPMHALSRAAIPRSWTTSISVVATVIPPATIVPAVASAIISAIISAISVTFSVTLAVSFASSASSSVSPLFFPVLMSAAILSSGFWGCRGWLCWRRWWCATCT